MYAGLKRGLSGLTATLSSRTGEHRLILIGQVSAYFGLVILTLRNFVIYPAHHYGVLVVVMLIGFLPSFIYRLLPSRTAPFILLMNALALVSSVFVLMQEWALAGVFVLVPVYALLFRDRAVYLFATGTALVLNVVLAWIFLYDAGNPTFSLVTMMDVMTVFMILVFIIYFVVKNLRTRYQEEARYLQMARHPSLLQWFLLEIMGSSYGRD